MLSSKFVVVINIIGMTSAIVTCYWGGERLPIGDDFVYSLLPKKTVKIPCNESLKKLRQRLYKYTQADPSKISLSLSFKYPLQTFAGGVGKWTVQEISDDEDVELMLSIPTIYFNGKGAVELYIDFEEVIPTVDTLSLTMGMPLEPTPPNQADYMQDDPLRSFRGSRNDYGSVDLGNDYEAGGSMMDYGAGGSGLHVGSSSQYAEPNIVEPVHSSHEIVRALCSGGINDSSMNNDEDLEEGSDSDFAADGGDNGDSDPDTSDTSSSSADEHGEGGTHDDRKIQLHVPTAPWFETEEVEDVNMYDDQVPTGYNIEADNLFEGQLFADKEQMSRVIKTMHVRQHKQFKVEYSNKERYRAVCKQPGCQWSVRVIKREKHQMWEVRRLGGIHTCVYANPTQDHIKLSSKMIADSIRNHVSYRVRLHLQS